MELEQLLNRLIQRGWKPFGMEDVFIDTGEGYDFEAGWIILKKEKGGTYTCESKYMPYRMLCTKSSGLWQFVCENGMQVGEFNNRSKNNGDLYTDIYYEYFIIESALCDEDKLEDFILQNIQLGQ